jgi:hypothetical protein
VIPAIQEVIGRRITVLGWLGKNLRAYLRHNSCKKGLGVCSRGRAPA